MHLRKDKLFKSKDFVFGLCLTGLYIFWYFSWLIYAGILKPGKFFYEPKINLAFELMTPFQDKFFLGTDVFGRSLVELLSAGLSYSLTMGFVVTFFAASFGIFIAYISVISNNFVNKLLLVFTNLIFIFPTILIAIVFMSFSGNSLNALIFVLIFTGWPGYMRIARGEIKRVLGLSSVESARAIGVSETRLFFSVIVPAILPQMIIHMVLGISGVIISEAVLGFLGLGGSEYSWGAMLAVAKDVLLEAPHLVMILSIVMAGLIIALNLLGDGLRDVLDPKNNEL